MRAAFLVLVVVASVAAAGCAAVKPHERETHSRATMQDPEPVEEKLEEHVHEYREGSVGGSGVGGGGCGCN